jgi:acyl carrier protein
MRKEQTAVDAEMVRRNQRDYRRRRGISRIHDADDFHDDLFPDSFSLIESMVDVDLAFRLGLPDERYQHVRSVSATAELVLERRKELDANPIPPP